MITLGLESEEKASHAPNWHATPPSPPFTHVLWYLSPPPTPTPPKERQRRIFDGRPGHPTEERAKKNKKSAQSTRKPVGSTYGGYLRYPPPSPDLRPSPPPDFRSGRSARPLLAFPATHPTPPAHTVTYAEPANYQPPGPRAR